MKILDKKVNLPINLILPVLTFTMGLVFFLIGVLDYGFWDAEGLRPTKGFFVIIVSVALIICSILAFIQELKKEKMEFYFRNWLVPAGLICIMLSSLVFGLVLSIFAFIILWIKVYEKLSWKATITTLLIVAFIVIGCFQLWLGIDFPQGLIFNMIFG